MTGKPNPLGRYFASHADRLAHSFLVVLAVGLSVLQVSQMPFTSVPTALLIPLGLIWLAALVALGGLWFIPVTALEHDGIRRPFSIVHRSLAWGDITDVRARRGISGKAVVVQLRDGGRVKLARVPPSAIPALRSYLGIDGAPAQRGSWWLVGYAVGSASSTSSS